MVVASPARRLPGGAWAEVEALQHHWEALDDDRKTLFAQMAVLTRWAGGVGPPVSALHPDNARLSPAQLCRLNNE